jgi:glycosyltransferase involved in cell wall biosynthesis
MALSVLERGPWAKIHHIVPHAAQVMKEFSPRLAAMTSLLPDPVETPPDLGKDQARALLGIPQEGRVLSLAGLIEARKGVRELLSAFERIVPRLRHNDRLLLAGKATTEMRELIESRYSMLEREGRIVFLNRHLTKEELWAACIGADVVCTPYPEHLFSASIVIRAARVGVPVLANAIGWMEQTIHRFGLGTTCDTLNTEVFAENIQTSLDASADFRLSPFGKRFIAFHTPENFATRLTRRVAQRIGCTDPCREVCWEDEVANPQPVLLSA